MVASDSLDTNCLARWLLRDVPEQADRVEKLLANGHQHHVADMAIMELAYVLMSQYRQPRSLVADNLKVVASHPNIICNRVLLHHVLPLFLEHPTLSFVDCCLATYANLNNATPLYTFERKLANQSPHATFVPA